MTEGHISAGDFSIEEATLILSGGETLDISGVIVEIEFFESIDSPAISGIVSFVNTDGLSNLGPIIGQEFLKLKIKTPSYDEKDTFDFTKNVLHVTNVTSGQVGNNGEILFLHVITSEIVKNEKTIVSRSMEGTYSDFVRQLLEYDLECKKPLDIQETSGIRRYVLPRSKPFDLIKNFRRKAVSADNVQSPSPTFVFFENFRGYHFKTLEKLYIQEPVMSYFESSTGVTTKNKGKGMGIDGPAMTNKLTRELSTIKTSVVVNDKDTLKNISRGALSSELNTFDLVTKQFNGGKGPTSPFKYNYFEDRKNEKHINNVSTDIDGNKISDNPIYSDVTSYGQRISDKTSVHFLSFTATDPDSGGDALHSAASAKRPTTAAHDENDAIDTTPQTDKQKREDRATINVVVGDGTGGNVTESQSKIASIRRQPIRQDLKNILATAGKNSGINVDVRSGGQPAKGSGGKRTGSVRHDEGGAADVALLDAKTNRRLSLNNLADQPKIEKFIREARAAGATGFGAHGNYMGGNTFHIDNEYAKTNCWGDTHGNSSAPSWLKEAIV